MADERPRYWLNNALDKIEARFPGGKILVSSGISPSASYHIGHFREILSADMVKVGLEQRGRKAKHIHVVDNFDPLRKRYAFLPEDYEQYVGWPVCLVPDPEDCHDSYAEHFFQDFYQWIPMLNIEADVIRSYQDLYQNGRLAQQIEVAVNRIPKIRTIFKEMSNRELPEDWAPLQILSENNRFGERKYKEIDTNKKLLKYVDQEGMEGWTKYDDGKVKLNWRLDWPARWQELGVMVEPHGLQEHGASGGSYSTGLRFAKEIFGFEGPLAGIQYGHVHLAGDTIKMSSSKGNLITPEQAFEIMPTEMLRYFYVRYPGKKRIDFDPGLGLYRMMDEFSKVSHDVHSGQPNEFEPAYRLAVAGLKEPGLSSIPFNHLVSIYQAALGDTKRVHEVLRRTGYTDEVKEQQEAINRELVYVKNWLANWAPEEVKFAVNKTSDQSAFNEDELTFLSKLADAIEAVASPDGQRYHELIHEVREEQDLEAGTAFKIVYRALINKESGPKAGWFMSLLDKDLLIKLFRFET